MPLPSEFDTLDHVAADARDHMPAILAYALCKGRGFVGSWRASLERRHHRLALH